MLRGGTHDQRRAVWTSGGMLLALVFVVAAWAFAHPHPASAAVNTKPPSSPVKLIFIHHSTGQAWLADGHGGLGKALRDSNYFVSDTNYGWGPGNVGDNTDIGDWWTWFRGPSSATYLSALYAESDQHCSYSRLAKNPGGPNQIVMFKSCFPNSRLKTARCSLCGPPIERSSAGSSTSMVPMRHEKPFLSPNFL